MIKFPSDEEPKIYTSMTQASSKTKWASIIASLLVGALGVYAGWPLWLMVGIAMLVYVWLPLVIGRMTKKNLDQAIVVDDSASEELIAQWKKILADDPPKSWALFSHGTCVVFHDGVNDVKSMATALIKQWGPYAAGNSSADMTVLKLRSHLGFVVGSHHPSIFNFVPLENGVDENTPPFVAGMMGRASRDSDARTHNIIHVEA